MQYLVTASEMKQYDNNTITKLGIPGLVLMERAALSVREELEKRFITESVKDVLIVAGTGNNGADGLALARLLMDKGVLTYIMIVGDYKKATESFQTQYRILKNMDAIFIEKPQAEEYTIVVDALFGVGLSRNLEGEYQQTVERLNSLKGFKVSVDLPSGIHSDTGKICNVAFKADLTVTFGFAKLGSVLFPGCEYAGELVVKDIGINERAFFGDEPKYYRLTEKKEVELPKRKSDGNKGSFGKALLAAGSMNMAGAAVLSAKAAYRIGAGMVKVVSPKENRVILQASLPEALYTDTLTEEDLKWATVLGIGPGLSTSTIARQMLETFLCSSDLPIVIDADAINLLAQEKQLREQVAEQGGKGRIVILTPHVVELKRLWSAVFSEEVPMEQWKEKLPEYAYRLACKLHCVVVAKDARTFICKENHPVCVNVRGNSGLAKAGSGDVLAGMILGLLSQKESDFESAAKGVVLHALLAEKNCEIYGEHGCMAGDLAEIL